jgi:hypothetical protein
MKGVHKFSPETGVELSEEQHYDRRGIARRAPDDSDIDDDHWGDRPEGLLTNGELVSSRYALANYFRRCHLRHHDEEHDQLYRSMALALRRLKTRTDRWDVWVWYALAERLARKNYDIDWMFNYAEARCPRCSGPLKWEGTANGLQGKCAINCRNEWNQDYLEPDIRKKVLTAYNKAFPNGTISRLEASE